MTRKRIARHERFRVFGAAKYSIVVMILLLAGGLSASWLAYRSPGMAAGWQYQVYATDLESVSALALDGAGGMYATLEKQHGQGRLVHLSQGKVADVLGDMDKPDGILRLGNSIFITNESGEFGLIEYKSGVLRRFVGISEAEGIADAGDNHLLIVEDRKTDGRLLRVDKTSGRIEVLLDGLKEAEGVCRDGKGDIYYVEKTASHLYRYRDGQVTSVHEGLVKPAFLNCMDDGSILITEDRTNFGRLLRFKDGTMTVIATRLHSPQSTILGSDGALYVAEQGRDRILRLSGASR